MLRATPHGAKTVFLLKPMTAVLLSVFALTAYAQEGASQTPVGEAVLDDVVVTSTPTVKPNVAKINPKAPIQPIPAPDGASLLKTVPNMTVIRKGGIDGDPLFRGLGGSRLAITADDHHLFGGCGGRMDPPTAYIYPENYDEVIITKGPQSVTQGPGLVAGSVQFVRQTPRFDQATLKFDGSLTAGSAERFDAYAGLTAGWKYGYARLNWVDNRAENYSDGNGKEIHSAYKRNSQNLQVGITPDKKTTIEASYDRSRGHAAYADRAMDGIQFDRDAWNISVARRDLTPWLSELKAQYGHSYVDHVMDNYSLRPNAGMKMENNPDRTTDTARLQADLGFEKVQAKVGLDWMDDQHTLRNGNSMKSYTLNPRQNDQHFRNLGVYAEGTWLMDEKNRLVAGYRHDSTQAQYQEKYANYAAVQGTPWEDQTYRLHSGFVRFERRDGAWTSYAGVGVGEAAKSSLPQTLAVTQAVFVQTGDTTYAVPVASVSGIGRISRERFEAGGGVYRYAGEEYALHDLGLLVGQGAAKAEGQAQVPLLLVRAGDLRAAVAIDQVVGNREIVVKPVGLQISSVPGIYGATITGDGHVVVILDVAPLVRRHLAQPERPAAVEPQQARHVPLVMVVDDSLTMRKVTGRVLERHNFEVVVARDGIEALERLEERVPDLMLLDIEMPRMDGYELATAMRADDRFRGVPIVMITSRTGEKHRQRAVEIGVQRYLGKPYQELDLMRNVYDLLGIARVRG